MTGQAQDTVLLHAVFDAAVDAIVVSDRNGIITGANRAAGHLFGYDTQEMAGKNVTMLMPAEMASQHDQFMDRYLETGEKRIIGIGRDVEGLRRDGSVFPLHLSVGRVVSDGEAAFVAILHDLSRRRAVEEALERSHRLDAIGRMTGGIAHDFNNLLTIIIGNLELLDMRVTKDADRELVSDAIEAAEMGADLTSRLLVFARKSALSDERLNLNDVARNAMAILSRTLSARYSIRVSLADGLGDILADRTQLQTSILNLALNAQDAMPDGGRIVLETATVNIDDTYLGQETGIQPGTYVRLSLTDTGDGMPMDTQRRAFEPFFTTKPAGKGTGLGLSMVYGFVKQSGGHVTLYSEPGQGTTVSLYFPRLDCENREGHCEEDSTLRPRSEKFGEGRTVLIAEDDPQVRNLARQRFIDLGFRVVEAASADEACELLHDIPNLSLLFTDIIMPGQRSGMDLVRHVLAEMPDVAVIVSTGYAGDLVNSETDYEVLRKPYRQADLVDALKRVMGDD